MLAPDLAHGRGLALAAGSARDDPGGIIVTILIAIAGAIVGGLIASALRHRRPR